MNSSTVKMLALNLLILSCGSMVMAEEQITEVERNNLIYFYSQLDEAEKICDKAQVEIIQANKVCDKAEVEKIQSTVSLIQALDSLSQICNSVCKNHGYQGVKHMPRNYAEFGLDQCIQKTTSE